MAHPILDFEMDKDTTTVKDRVVKLRGIYTWGAHSNWVLPLAVCSTFIFLLQYNIFYFPFFFKICFWAFNLYWIEQ